MRLVTWNLGCAYGGTYKASQPRCWQQLLAWEPQIALIQETLEPIGVIDRDRYVFTPYGWSQSHARPVGTLVYAASGALAPIELALDRQLPGQVTAATLDTGSSRPLVLASIHAATSALDPAVLSADVIEEASASHTTKVFPIDLVRTELTKLTAGQRFIVGGDLNLSIRFDDLYTPGSDFFGNVEWFTRVRGAGWWNAHRKFHTGDQRTLFRPSHPNELFQIDHLFTDKKTWTKLVSCDVLQVPFLEEFTDHAPLVLHTEDL